MTLKVKFQLQKGNRKLKKDSDMLMIVLPSARSCANTFVGWSFYFNGM